MGESNPGMDVRMGGQPMYGPPYSKVEAAVGHDRDGGSAVITQCKFLPP